MTAGRWERAAEQYASGEHRYGEELGLAVEYAAPTGIEHVLDVGSGGGHMALAIAPRVNSVVLTDPVQAMLDASRRVFSEAGQGNARFIEAAAENLPFDDGSFEIVTSRLAAHHFEDLNAALREIARVLKPGGVLVLVDTVAPEDGEAATYLHEVETLRDPTHRHTLTRGQWLRLCQVNRFLIERSDTVRKAHDFEPWLLRGGEDAAVMARVRERFLEAPLAARAALDIVVRDGSVVSFTDTKLILAARL